MKQILVVEDESIIARDLQKNLQRLGYHVPAVAFSSEEALEVVSANLPDLVLMDINLGTGGDGIEVAQSVRSQFNIPVVFLTAYSDPDTLQRAKVTQPFGYLIKPFEERELVTTIEMALHNHEMERRLKESEEWLKATLNSIADAVIATDKGGVVEFMNPIAELLTGWQKEAASGKHITEIFQSIHEASRAIARNPLLAALAKEGSVAQLEPTLLISREGTEIPISQTAAPIRDNLGNINGAVLVFQDITLRKALEAQLSHSIKMEAIGRLAGGVAHDFNNMMAAVIGYSQLLLSKFEEDSPFYFQLTEIKNSGERAASLTRQLLAFSRKQILRPVELNLNETVENMLRMLRRSIPENIELIKKLSPDLGCVKIDPTQIEQVILNLALNARDAMPDGGILCLETANLYLEEIAAQQKAELSPGQYVVLTISDTGHGMSQETLSQIFEPFFTTKEMGRGTGLGLSMVFGIIKQSGGDIQVASEPGKGTTFKIYLQHHQKKVDEKPEISPEQKLLHGTEVILIVEDEEVVRKMLCKILQSRGYQIVEAVSGQEALDICSKQITIDLIISEMIMPGISGRDLGERLKTIRPEKKLLYMSGYTEDVIPIQQLENPSTTFIQKPFVIEELFKKVRDLLDA